MDAHKKRRAVLRTAFTRVANQLLLVLDAAQVDLVEAESLQELLQQKAVALKVVDEEVFSLLLSENADEDDIAAEISSCDEYAVRAMQLRIRYNKIALAKSEVSSEGARISDGFTSAASQVGASAHKLRLPKIELMKFGGEIRDWLPFWSQFKKIDDATDLDPDDKFQYLLLAITPNTRARDLVESFPATADNYEKVIESFKSRFGREDLLVEVYVRELLKLVLNNALCNHSRCGITTLYDKIETQLRSLETLGINTDTCSAMLYPLVESCLPEELLCVWQRATSFSEKPDATLKNRLDRLMNFLKAEVEGAERISLAVEGFDLDTHAGKQKINKRRVAEQGVPTAAGLMNNNVSMRCVFCEGNHNTERCFKAQRLSFEEKKSTLVKKKACFRCAKVGHPSRRCRERVRCVMCGGQHIVLLCPDLKDKPNEKDKKNASENQLETQSGFVTETGLANCTDARVFLQTLIVRMRSERGERDVRAIIDTGSQRSYVLKHVAEELQYQAKRTETIVHVLFGGAQTAEQRHACYDVRLVGLDGKFACRFEALDQPVICNDIPSISPGIWSKELQKAKIHLTDTKGRQPIHLLIGADIAGKIFTGRRQILSCGLTAIETLLGWVLMGKVPGRQSPSATMMVTNMLNKEASITALWQLDILGISDPGERKTKAELEVAAKQLFEETVCVTKEGRYEVKLPWLEGHPPLPSNYALVEKRLQSTENKLRSSGYWDKYNEVFSEWVQDGVIEEVPIEELDRPAHYLPHRPVIKESSSTTKVRPVFDASAREKGKPSLNDCLEKGTNLIEQIPVILLRFRKERIGVTSDIKKAFLQIGVSPSDRDFLRFIWKTADGNDRILRHKRVVFGVNASPFLLGATIEHHLKTCLARYEEGSSGYSKQTIEMLLKCFYVDNCVTSLPNIEALEEFISEATMLMAEAKFDLRGWEFTGQSDDGTTTLPLLGLNWNKVDDTFSINYVQGDESEVTTKRVILSLAQRIFDPIGFTSPATLCPKLLLQAMWEEKIGWDTEVKDESRRIFEKWKSELPFLFKIEIPRWIYVDQNEEQELSLHIFCDASKLAYATVVFLRAEGKGTIRIQLLQAKARIAPIKKMSIPRLELMAATIGARLGSQIREVLGIDMPVTYWSDSTTVLNWIRRTDEWATFVWNRVQEIRSSTSIDAWRHVPGEQNPADLPSRGCSPKQLAVSKWWEGPSWLLKDMSEWPQKVLECDEEEVNKERKMKVVTTMLNVLESRRFYEYFSRYRGSVRLIAWMYRFVHNAKRHGKHGELSAEEMDHAERKLIWMIQKESFSEKDSRLATLNILRDDDGILRLETRISLRDDLQSFRLPYVLPGQHPLVKRLIYDAHVNSSHVGIQGLLSILRERYWILGGRRTIRSVISTCTTCRRYSSKRLEVNTPALPLERISEAVCFEVTGVDFAGPLYLKDGKKAWVCLYTCAVYRAVHLEVVTTLSTNGFIQALRRFVARRGRPRIIYSDNGTNFVGTANIFRQLSWEEIKKYSAEQRISWRFSPPSAPWWGGWWERLVGLVKQLLRRVLGRARLNGEELYTVLCDCESVINSRPLTYVSNEPGELVPLTPAMFLRELTNSGVPDCDLADSTSLNKRFRYLQRLRGDLRKRFRVEYLGQLRQTMKPKVSRGVTVNEVVFVGNDNTKRLDWPLGRVVELLPGKDSQVRLVRVQTKNGQLLRPLQRLYPLEGFGSSPEDGTSLQGASAEAEYPAAEERCVSERVSRYGRKLKVPQRLHD